MSDLPKPMTARGEATRRRLLEAAEVEIAGKGFSRASISGITRRAGVGQGTFYLYFPSKEDALRELVRHMGRELRHALSAATRGVTDRLEVERRGLAAFLRFSLEHQDLYRVVMESQFVDESIYREYYQTLADAYARGLGRAQAGGEIRSGHPETQAWALMGIAHFLGLRYTIWDRRAPPDEAMSTALDMILHGLEPG
ncbi:MAG TPA: TetR/AcrR family transcriptional regulator [Trueperaceae bacterium]|nr:TetR/AcrR family transcriptional regulator [Trueperaceae bacterium]